MKVNKHLMKDSPLYNSSVNGFVVKLLKITNHKHGFNLDGLTFTAEIMEGAHKGKWTTVLKKNLKLVK